MQLLKLFIAMQLLKLFIVMQLLNKSGLFTYALFMHLCDACSKLTS